MERERICRKSQASKDSEKRLGSITKKLDERCPSVRCGPTREDLSYRLKWTEKVTFLPTMATQFPRNAYSRFKREPLKDLNTCASELSPFDLYAPTEAFEFGLSFKITNITTGRRWLCSAKHARPRDDFQPVLFLY